MERTAEQYEYERKEAIQALRSLCQEYGDTEWTEDLHLADIITKHLEPHLEAGPADLDTFLDDAFREAGSIYEHPIDKVKKKMQSYAKQFAIAELEKLRGKKFHTAFGSSEEDICVISLGDLEEAIERLKE